MNNMIVSTPGQRLRHARVVKGISQGELSRRTQVSKGTISMAERDITKLTTSNLRAMCSALGVPSDYVLWGHISEKNDEWDRLSGTDDGLALRQSVLNLWKRKKFVPFFSSLLRLRDEEFDIVFFLVQFLESREQGKLQTPENLDNG